MYTGWGKDGTARLFARYTLPYPWFRTYLHVSRIGGRAWFTQILASEGRRVKIYPSPPPSLPLIADHRSARDGKRVKPSDRLFARRINICSSACFYVCPDNFVAHGTRARVMFAPTFLPPPLTIISEISQGAAHVYQSVRVSQVGDAITRLENWWIWSETRIEIWRFLLKDDFLICLVRYVGIFKCIEIGRGWFWIYLYDN